MHTYELTQKILAWGPTYEVRNTQSADVEPLCTIKGKLFSATPSLSINQGLEGPPVGAMKGNFARTKFECRGADDTPLGSVQFPLLALKKSFTLKTGDQEYQADGGYLAGEFVCKDAAGNVVLKITKELSLRDKFRIETNQAIPTPLALLAAVAVDQRFFQEA